VRRGPNHDEVERLEAGAPSGRSPAATAAQAR
jgi:hypothetical protein